jgi:hypothetical protein
MAWFDVAIAAHLLDKGVAFHGRGRGKIYPLAIPTDNL